MAVEQEFRFALSEEEAALLLDTLGAPQRTIHQESHYFDTRDGCLRAHLYGLRLRIEDRARRVLTLKGPPLAGPFGRPGVDRREETEIEVAFAVAARLLRGESRLDDLGLALPAELAREAGREPLVPLGAVITLRRRFRMSAGPAHEMELDEALFPDGSRFHDLEVEWQGAEGSKMESDLHSFLRRLGIEPRPQPLTKLARLMEHRARPGNGRTA